MLKRLLRIAKTRRDGAFERGQAVKLPSLTTPTPHASNSFFLPIFWGLKEPQTFATSVQSMTADLPHGFHAADNFITWGRNNSMLDDVAFRRAWESNAETDVDRAIVWRRYVLACAAHHCVQLEGDFVECGSYTGVGVKTVVDYLGGMAFPKTFWAYDLFEHFEGMPNQKMEELGPQLFGRVQAKFAAYPQVRLVRGMIPASFEGNVPDRIAYLHIDLNQAAAELAALDSLFDRVVPGGIVVLDDYEWSGVFRPQKLAEDPWFDRRGYRVMPLPTGQGLVIKR